MARQHQRQLATRAVHAGTATTAGDFTPTAPPIHHSSTFRYETMEELDAVFGGTRSGYVYSRFGNPTTAAFEEAVASLESADSALAFASGMAALHAALLASGARSGATVVAARDIYGATQSLLNRIFGSQGVSTRFVDTGNLDEVRNACAELGPVAIVVETISNPLLRVADLPRLAEIAHNTGATLLVDNTFASPYLVQPFKLGADMVIHSATKYLGGHRDVLGGVVASSTHGHDELLSVRKLTGANLGPQEAWLALRGVRTLAVRMRQHCENASHSHTGYQTTGGEPRDLPGIARPSATHSLGSVVRRARLRRDDQLRAERRRADRSIPVPRCSSALPARHQSGRRPDIVALSRPLLPPLAQS
ncbi:MAG: PLP-dependent aspartate aminotransferase family protein [Anaerolineae bacterium]|nr:PLP-dependent aspartate aminotransferase family protein [Anaerolineae bacterium]